MKRLSLNYKGFRYEILSIILFTFTIATQSCIMTFCTRTIVEDDIVKPLKG